MERKILIKYKVIELDYGEKNYIVQKLLYNILYA